MNAILAAVCLATTSAQEAPWNDRRLMQSVFDAAYIGNMTTADFRAEAPTEGLHPLAAAAHAEPFAAMLEWEYRLNRPREWALANPVAALIAVLQDQLALGTEGKAVGTWRIGYDQKRGAFVFDHCENDGYCEERPAVIAIDGKVLDPGGPLFD